MKYKFVETSKRKSLDTPWPNHSRELIQSPWLIVGFENKPDWWVEKYGETYTAENQCWIDIQEGKINGIKKEGIVYEAQEVDLIQKYIDQGFVIDYSESGYDSLEYTSSIVFLNSIVFEQFSAEQNEIIENSNFSANTSEISVETSDFFIE